VCGRYARWSRRQRVEELLGIESSGEDFPDLYNITPGTKTLIVRAKDGKPTLASYLRGLVPYWSKDPKKGARPVNARAETAHEKPMFKKFVRERRCLIPANCYYEYYLSSPEARYLMAKLIAPSDALCKPLLPETI
jgi:putative SOS response-associated peptidase YedK